VLDFEIIKTNNKKKYFKHTSDKTYK